MTILKRHVIEVALHERGVLVEDGVAVRALGPGRHVVWAFLKKVEVVRYDARLATRVAKSVEEVLYLGVQLALREAVASHMLDELLARRELLVDALAPALQAKARALGLELLDLGVRDLILPGEMKALLNRVIEAQKEAEANVILRREETAATRSLAQTAKVLGENPLLVRLKELEAYKDLAQKVGTVHVVMGETGLARLELKT
jgi:regulator of protease activity HflC (stomatin/prohibitin superfamily)